MSRTTSRRDASTPVGAIYARYSSRFQHSIDDQVRTCRQWAETNGISVPDEFVFVDRAVSGRSARRHGLRALRETLEKDQVDVVIIFTTNRLFRKTYQSLAFVEEEIVDRGKRCVFVRSALDTAETDHWRQLLQMYGMIDEFVIQMTAEHVRAAHEGLLLRTRVFGTVTYGYAGEPIDGETTRRGLPARRLVVDPVASEWVKRVFHWFVSDRLSIREIIRRLNASNAPLPPRSCSRRWTRLAVRRLLSNARYRGWWEYGRMKTVWLNRKGYLRQIERDEPIATTQIDDLRIIDDATWYAAEKRLSQLRENGGRRPKDGDIRSRPRVLNGLLYCSEHNRPLYVCGSNGKYMHCRECQDAAEPALYSMLPRRLALDLICRQLAGMIRGDECLVDQVIAACHRHVQAEAEGDPMVIADLRRNVQRLNTQIAFILDAPGETDQDRVENRERLARLRGERSDVQRRIAEIEEAARNPKSVPTDDEVRTLIDNMATTLTAAADSDNPTELAALHHVISELTGGRISMTQQGERKRHNGWLRAKFRVRLLGPLTHRSGFPVTNDDDVEVELDIKRPSRDDELAEQAKALYDDGRMAKEIARRMDCHRNRVAQLLKHWAEVHGEELPDGRARRATLSEKQSEVPLYKKIADEVTKLWLEQYLAYCEIARRFECSDVTVAKAIAYWHRERKMPIPTAKDRRRHITKRGRRLFDDGWEIKAIADALGYTPRGMKLLLEQSFRAEGSQMPDGRSRSGHTSRAS